MKTDIERSFTRASLTYDTYADVQLEVARLLMSKLTGGSYRRIFEVGCGTGCYTAMLSDAFSGAIIEAIDISTAMIEVARKKSYQEGRLSFHVADGETPPLFIRGPFDLITANGVFHWFIDMEASLKRLKDLLSADGTIMFSSFGPLTLKELTCILSETFNCNIVLPAKSFPDYKKIRDILSRLFKHVYIDELLICREYQDVFSLLRNLKSTGVSPSIQSAPPLRLTSARLSRMDDLYRRCFGAIRASYQVFFCEVN